MEPDKKSTTQPNSTSAPAPNTSATESTSNTLIVTPENQ
jgi:hypothetical protein